MSLLAYVKRPFVVVLELAVVLNVVLWIVTLYLFPVQEPAAVLHYSIDVGIDFIGEGKQIMALPLAGSGLLIFNVVLGLAIWRADVRAAWILWSVLPGLQLLLLAAWYVLWRINI